MALGVLHGTPYRTVKALGAWAVAREGYLRGRLRLVGEDWGDLNLRERLDVVEAIFAEGVAVDANLDGLEKAIRNAYPDRKEWGLAPEQRAALAAAEAMYGQAAPLTPEQKAERERKRAERLAAAERESARTVEPDVPDETAPE